MMRTVALIVLSNLAFGSVSVLGGDSYSRQDFPSGFIFGSGTSAYQVEGAASEDGRTPSVWDTFTHQGFVNGDTGDVAADGYHKYKEDVQLMVQTGLDAYRFSISWPRLLPNGRGAVNPKGLQYYNNLINELISHGIQPHVTLFHYDHPQVLEDEYGGWLSRKIVKDFTDFADVCFREFGDRVSYWTTLNEPNVYIIGGYDTGLSPPRRCSPPFGSNCTKGNSSTEPYLVAHHILMAHGSAVRLYREKYQGKQVGHIGINLLVFGYVPLTNSPEDVVATQRAKDFFTGLFMNPLLFGDYPDTVKKNAGLRLPAFSNYESELVKGSFDFVGVNYYYTLAIKDNSEALKTEHRDFTADMAIELSLFEMTTSLSESSMRSWGLQLVLEDFKQAYGNPPIYIHENGQRSPRNSSLEDISRVKFLHLNIWSLLDAVRNGSNARGYFTWSFLDVFEFFDGYKSSYGLYYVDRDDLELKRYPKFSAHWFSHFLKGGNVSSDQVIQLATSSSPVSDKHFFQ
ncbi:hydroxyisourate hydrolase-like isoform X1 [Mercurialis annua]|uniref:hydroxyisourate hydrolase-like isoform X1 n=1 Tax=Mercurialis annua TaxID=3986 RepID=UPI00215E11D5|nr:hydroxyisourate hydrolase-like isoform X1 [Mercurialis annua]